MVEVVEVQNNPGNFGTMPPSDPGIGQAARGAGGGGGGNNVFQTTTTNE